MQIEVIDNLVVPIRRYLAHASYGAIKYLPQSRLTRHFEWIHGWRPTWFDAYPEEGTGRIDKNRLYGVADPNHQSLIRSFGADAWVVGLPFAYELFGHKEPLSRLPNSCIYLPPHYTHEHKEDVDTHIETFINDLSRYDNVTICLHWANYRHAAIRESYRKYGWTVVEGANNNDVNSLTRMIYLFKQHEYLAVDYYGSHIAYAAACGTKLHFVPENISRLELDCSGLSNIDANKRRELTSLDTIAGALQAHCESGGSSLSWGQNEIGYQYVDKATLNCVKYVGIGAVTRRLAAKVSHRLGGGGPHQSNSDHRAQLASFINEKTYCRQPILTCDSVVADQLSKYDNPITLIERSDSRLCRCSNSLETETFDFGQYGTVALEYCSSCMPLVINRIQESSSHAKVVLYTYVNPTTHVDSLLPANKLSTLYDMRIFQYNTDVSRPEVMYCVACVVDKDALRHLSG